MNFSVWERPLAAEKGASEIPSREKVGDDRQRGDRGGWVVETARVRGEGRVVGGNTRERGWKHAGTWVETRGNGPGPWAHRLRLLRRFLFRPRSLRGGWPGGLRIHVGPVVRSLGAVGEGQRPVDAFVRHPDAPLPVAKDRGTVTGTRGACSTVGIPHQPPRSDKSAQRRLEPQRCGIGDIQIYSYG